MFSISVGEDEFELLRPLWRLEEWMRRPVESRGPCLPSEECDGPQAGAAAGEENRSAWSYVERSWKSGHGAELQSACLCLENDANTEVHFRKC